MTTETQATETQTTTEEAAPKWAQELVSSMKEMTSGLQTIVTTVKSQPKTEAEEQVEDVRSILDENNLELLPRKEFAAKLEETFAAKLEAALKPLQEQLVQTSNQQTVDKITQEAIRFAEKTPQMGEWEKEMMGIAEKNPTMSVPDIYLLARAKNPAKAAEMDAKYKDASTTTTTTTQAKPPAAKKPPLAITPQSSSSEVTNQRMSPDEAARDAWEKSVAKFGNVFG